MGLRMHHFLHVAFLDGHSTKRTRLRKNRWHSLILWECGRKEQLWVRKGGSLQLDRRNTEVGFARPGTNTATGAPVKVLLSYTGEGHVKLLLRSSYRVGGKVKKYTVASVTCFNSQALASLEDLLRQRRTAQRRDRDPIDSQIFALLYATCHQISGGDCIVSG
jgi:hypothetical protein